MLHKWYTWVAVAFLGYVLWQDPAKIKEWGGELWTGIGHLAHSIMIVIG